MYWDSGAYIGFWFGGVDQDTNNMRTPNRQNMRKGGLGDVPPDVEKIFQIMEENWQLEPHPDAIV